MLLAEDEVERDSVLITDDNFCVDDLLRSAFEYEEVFLVSLVLLDVLLFLLKFIREETEILPSWFFCEIDVFVGTIWELESFLFLFSTLSATVSSASFPFLNSFSLFSAAFVTSEFSGIVEGLQDDLVLEDDADLAPADIGPVVDDRTFVSTLSADFALATIPLLNDDFTWNGKIFYTSYI